MMIDFSKAPCCYWSDNWKASYLQRQILIHSIMYYEMSETVIEDFQFDSMCKQLIQLSEKMGDDYKETQYYKYFYDFTGETGYYFYDRLSKNDKSYLKKIIDVVLRSYKSGGSK